MHMLGLHFIDFVYQHFVIWLLQYNCNDIEKETMSLQLGEIISYLISYNNNIIIIKTLFNEGST